MVHGYMKSSLPYGANGFFNPFLKYWGQNGELRRVFWTNSSDRILRQMYPFKF